LNDSARALRPGGPFTPINVPGAPGTGATGINDAGVIVGPYTNPFARPGRQGCGGAARRGQAAVSCSAAPMAASVTRVMPTMVARITAAAMANTARRPSSSPSRPPAAAPSGLLPQATSR
jgi:hypothetical protein